MTFYFAGGRSVHWAPPAGVPVTFLKRVSNCREMCKWRLVPCEGNTIQLLGSPSREKWCTSPRTYLLFTQVDPILHAVLHLGFFLLRYTSQKQKTYILKCKVQWLRVYSLVCATVTTNCRMFLSPEKGTPYPLAVIPHSSLPHALAATNLLSLLMAVPVLGIERKWNHTFLWSSSAGFLHWAQRS